MASEEYQALNERLERIERMALLAAKEVLTVDEAALFTGYSKNHIYRMTSNRTIPFYKPMHGAIFFKKAELTDWLLHSRKATTQELESKAALYCSTHK